MRPTQTPPITPDQLQSLLRQVLRSESLDTTPPQRIIGPMLFERSRISAILSLIPGLARATFSVCVQFDDDSSPTTKQLGLHDCHRHFLLHGDHLIAASGQRVSFEQAQSDIIRQGALVLDLARKKFTNSAQSLVLSPVEYSVNHDPKSVGCEDADHLLVDPDQHTALVRAVKAHYQALALQGQTPDVSVASSPRSARRV